MRELKRRAASVARKVLKKSQHLIVADMRRLGRKRRLDVYQNSYTNEYIRLSSLELVAHEIITRGIPGASAELGVYQGHFAAAINAALPDRELYLFDTFEGFAAEEEQRDRENHGLSYRRDFSDTSVEVVLGRLPHPERCVVRRGWFPQTAAGLESETFSFVSIDTDLYEPILAGLEFFYDRLSPGGYLFVHDYNNSDFPGAQKAIREFSQSRGVPYVPLTDEFGTAIFTKAV
jgi:O-methyltransferase